MREWRVGECDVWDTYFAQALTGANTESLAWWEMGERFTF